MHKNMQMFKANSVLQKYATKLAKVLHKTMKCGIENYKAHYAYL